jgi:hypothetical protein
MVKLIQALVTGLIVGAIAGTYLGPIMRAHGDYLVYTEENPSAWHLRCIDDAEKKAHFLVYECDAKIALITDDRGQLITQVRKGDGRDLGTN